MAAAGEETVVLENDATVTVDVAGGGDGTTTTTTTTEEPSEGEGIAAAAVATEETVVEKPQRQRKSTAVDDAAKQLQEALAKAEKSDVEKAAALATADAERRRADEQARLAAEARDREAAAHEQVQDSQLVALGAKIDTATRDLDVAKRTFKEAHEAGDADKMAEAQVAIGTASASLVNLKQRKEEYEAAKARGATEAPPVGGRVEAPGAVEAREQWLSRFAPASASWLRAHPDCMPPEFGGNVGKNALMLRGHHLALADGHATNSPEYFRVIEDTINGAQRAATTTKPEVDEPTETTPAPAAAKPKPARAAVPAAPVSRDAPGPGGVPTQRSVTLTPQEQEVALFSYPAGKNETPDAHRIRAFGIYAKEKLAAQAEGKLGRITH